MAGADRRQLRLAPSGSASTAIGQRAGEAAAGAGGALFARRGARGVGAGRRGGPPASPRAARAYRGGAATRNTALTGPDLDDPSAIHHRDAVDDVPDDAEVVRDEHHRQALLAPDVGEEVEDLGADRDVERRHRLVGDDQVRLDRERAGDGDALALAAAELMRIGAGMGGVEPDPFEEARRPARRASARPQMPWTISGSASW